ncbi:hypothetical protein [Chondrinema litorale]|uniref:hypothetical protein n=1 Tax=Chondrinema litorale TaxID=2994555 RepID=UPI002543AF5A|nr:hypothetical protein [Chondrinema litorale]UZR93873.1 hypothetical protein OQ292_18665 [Chondrinema litorale]
MAKKSFKSEAEDIFGDYNEPVKSEKKITPKKIKQFQPFLLALEQQHLSNLKALAWHQQREIKDVLEDIMDDYFEKMQDLENIHSEYSKTLKK